MHKFGALFLLPNLRKKKKASLDALICLPDELILDLPEGCGGSLSTSGIVIISLLCKKCKEINY